MMAERINGVLIRKSVNLLRVERPQPVDLQVDNEDVAKVIKLIAEYAGASVAISPDVTGTISVKLKNAPWRAALQYVVETAGKYSLVEGDYGILRVVPTTSLELGSATYTFRYLRPPPPYKGVIKTGSGKGTSGSSGGAAAGGSAQVGADIVQSDVFVPSDDPTKLEDYFPVVNALRSIVEPDGGRVTYIPGSNAVLYTGTPPRMGRVRALCEQLDVEPPQIFIDMNIVATTNTDALAFGMQSDTGVAFGLTGASVTHRLPFAGSGAGWAEWLTGTDFPAPSAAQFGYGTLDFSQTQMLFQFLKQDGCSKVVQAPKILCLDNQEATIFVGESIRYARSEAASNQNGGLTFSVEEDENSPVNVGFQLLVIPHVIPGENKVTLLVIPQRRDLNGTTSPIPGFDRFTVSGQTIDLPRIASTTLVTTMMLRDKETAVIGGLLEEREVNGQDKLPILGDLPVLGALFRGQSRTDQSRNIIITITPRILRGSDAANTTVSDELAGRQDRLRSEFGTLGAEPVPTAPRALPAPAPVPTAPR
jgi:type II secretory pathway component GspD/PulD (secretin)